MCVYEHYLGEGGEGRYGFCIWGGYIVVNVCLGLGRVEVEYDDVVTEVVCWSGMVVVFVDKGGS
jgi:hypothetical protein